MTTRSPGGDIPIRRIDRILAFMALGLTVVSIVAVLTVLISQAAGVRSAYSRYSSWNPVANRRTRSRTSCRQACGQSHTGGVFRFVRV